MSFVTPVDGQPAIAEHVAQLTETLSGVRAEPLTLTATLTGRALNPSANNAYDLGLAGTRWRKLWGVDADLSGGLVTAGNVGVGVTPLPFGAGIRAVQVGERGALSALTSGGTTILSENTYFDGTNNRAIAAAAGGQVVIGVGATTISTAASVAAGAVQTMVERVRVSPVGLLTLTPDAGQDAINFSGATILRASGQFTLAGTSDMYVAPRNGASGGYFMPSVDNVTNLGNPSARWGTIYSSVGTINTSVATLKESITPLDPAACYQAAKDVRWYEFTYLPPVYTAPEPPPSMAYDASDGNETRAEKKALRDEAEAANKAAHLKMVVETAPARHQRGFVFPAGAESKDEAGGTLPPVPDLFGLSDRTSTTPQADLATLGCALQEVIRRLEALEGAAA